MLIKKQAYNVVLEFLGIITHTYHFFMLIENSCKEKNIVSWPHDIKSVKNKAPSSLMKVILNAH